MSELGEVIVELIHISRDTMTAKEIDLILIELNDIATNRKRRNGQTDLNDAILDWARDNFKCGDAGKDEHHSHKIEWS